MVREHGQMEEEKWEARVSLCRWENRKRTYLSRNNQDQQVYMSGRRRTEMIWAPNTRPSISTTTAEGIIP
jgi:hypothetical protein